VICILLVRQNWSFTRVPTSSNRPSHFEGKMNCSSIIRCYRDRWRTVPESLQPQAQTCSKGRVTKLGEGITNWYAILSVVSYAREHFHRRVVAESWHRLWDESTGRQDAPRAEELDLSRTCTAQAGYLIISAYRSRSCSSPRAAAGAAKRDGTLPRSRLGRK
jgi:hypothetical protein